MNKISTSYLIAASVCPMLFWFCLLASFPATAQNVASEVPYYSYGSGIGISSKDSLFLLNIRFRIQSRVAYKTESTSNLHLEELQTQIQRLRLRLDGFFYKPELIYVIQLGFSEPDLGLSSTNTTPSILKDAIIFYRINKHISLGFGLTNLPRNRQAVISSGDLELIDRSPLSAAFGIQRDFGLQFYYYNNIGQVYYAFRSAITAGEGKNAVNSDQGLSYTGRVELLPFGTFKGRGDYFEGDLEREENPKLALGITHNLNHNTTGTGGGSSTPLYESRNIYNLMADLLLKYQGLSFSFEHLSNTIRGNPITRNQEGEEAYAYVGAGQNWQMGYNFKSNWGIAGRFARLHPDKGIKSKVGPAEEVTLGLSKYIKGHRMKMQADISKRIQMPEQNFPHALDKYFLLRLQVEMGL